MSATKVIGTVDRYKRPVMKIKVEGRDKMVTTIILNMVQVAKALQVPPAYPTKFFSLKRGCQCNPGPEVYSVAGSHSLTDLENLLEEFINLCVLCPKCTLPETVMKVKKGAITRTCRACSYTGNLSVDTKLDSFILKNPPPKVKDLVARPSAAAGPSSSSGGAGGGDDEGMGDINIEAPDMSTVAIVDDGWAVDVSDAAAEERRRKEMGASAVIQAMLEHDADWTIDRSAEELTKWFEAERAKVTASSSTSTTTTTTTPTAASTGGAPAITKELVEATIAKGENLGRVHEHSSVEVLGLVLHVVWNEDAIKRFEVFEPIFKRLVKDAKGQRVVLGNIERLSSTHKALLPVLTNLFTKLYEGDYLEEEVIAKWASKVESKYVDTAHAKAVRTSIAPFLKFLEEDESEDDDEEGDDVDDDDDGDGDEDEEEEEDDDEDGDARVPQGEDDDEEEDDDGFNDDEEALALKAKSAGAGARGGGGAAAAAAKSPSGKGSSGAGAAKSAPPSSSAQSGKGKAASGPPPSSTAASRGKAPAAKPESDSEELDLDAI